MDMHSMDSEREEHLTIDRRIELILDLTRRPDLLDDLLCTARARRCARDTEIRLIEAEQVDINGMPAI